jgi:hypothetical protein
MADLDRRKYDRAFVLWTACEWLFSGFNFETNADDKPSMYNLANGSTAQEQPENRYQR